MCYARKLLTLHVDEGRVKFVDDNDGGERIRVEGNFSCPHNLWGLDEGMRRGLKNMTRCCLDGECRSMHSSVSNEIKDRYRSM